MAVGINIYLFQSAKFSNLNKVVIQLVKHWHIRYLY